MGADGDATDGPSDDPDREAPPDVGVFRESVHGLPAAEYAEALRERLPDRHVEVAATPEDERRFVERARVVTGLRVDEELVDRSRNLELFACTFAGTDHLPLEAFRRQRIAVTNASGVHGPNAGEYAVGALLSLVRRFYVARRRAERREWRTFSTDELHDSGVAVVGMGAIGTAVLQRLAGFGVDRIGVRHSPEKGGPAESVFGYDEFDAAVARADHLVLACPLTDVTEGLVDRSTVQTLGPGSTLVNLARGPVVDTDALVRALRAGDLAGAAVDVTDPEPLPAEHPLWTFENVLITPHNAGYTPEYYERLADIVAGNVRRLDRADGDADAADIENRVV